MRAFNVIHCDTLQAQLRRALADVAARLGCDAIEARALWGQGDSTIVEKVETGAAEGDVARLKRMPWPQPLPPATRRSVPRPTPQRSTSRR